VTLCTRFDRSNVLADAYREAWDRGKAWQEGLNAGLAMMPGNGKRALAAALGVPGEELGS
jgi:hypothetical protein